MTREEFHRKFCGRFLVFMADAWACRKQDPSSLGMLMDEHARMLRALLNDVYDTLHKDETVKKDKS